MKDLFCNECSLSYDVPRLVAEWLLGVEHRGTIEDRYEQMRKYYDYTYAEWQKVFTADLKPFKGYTDTTAVTIPMGNTKLSVDIKALHKGAIGVDLPTWFNIRDNNKRIVIIGQDPLRSGKWYGECYDAVVSSPFGQHDSEHRQKGNGGKMMKLLIENLVNNGFGVYLTDANKYFVYDHETTDAFSANHLKIYMDILQKELQLVEPALVVSLGRRAERVCRNMELPNLLALPHLSGTARGAIVKMFPELEESGATAENIAKEYADEINRIICNKNKIS